MTKTPTLEPGQKLQASKGSSNEPRTRGGHMNFNPLHPSMELPPEQLIRLLGMEGKKSRKKSRTAARPRKPVLPPVDELPAIIPERSTPAPARSRANARHTPHNEYERSAPPMPRKKRGRLPVTAIGSGLLALAAVTAYLGFGHSSDEPASPVAKPATTIKPPAARPASPLKKAPAPVTRPNSQAVAPVTAHRPTAHTESPAWHASVELQEQRLRAAAEQRLQQRMTGRQQEPGPKHLPTTATISATPAPRTVTESLPATRADHRPPTDAAQETSHTVSVPSPDAGLTTTPAPPVPASDTPDSATVVPPPGGLEYGTVDSTRSREPGPEPPMDAEAVDEQAAAASSAETAAGS